MTNKSLGLSCRLEHHFVLALGPVYWLSRVTSAHLVNSLGYIRFSYIYIVLYCTEYLGHTPAHAFSLCRCARQPCNLFESAPKSCLGAHIYRHSRTPTCLPKIQRTSPQVSRSCRLIHKAPNSRPSQKQRRNRSPTLGKTRTSPLIPKPRRRGPATRRPLRETHKGPPPLHRRPSPRATGRRRSRLRTRQGVTIYRQGRPAVALQPGRKRQTPSRGG